MPFAQGNNGYVNSSILTGPGLLRITEELGLLLTYLLTYLLHGAESFLRS